MRQENRLPELSDQDVECPDIILSMDAIPSHPAAVLVLQTLKLYVQCAFISGHRAVFPTMICLRCLRALGRQVLYSLLLTRLPTTRHGILLKQLHTAVF